MPLLSVFGSTAMGTLHNVAIFNPTHQNWCELNIGAPQLVGIHVYNFSGYLISDCHILFHVCCASAHLGLSLNQTVACDSPITQNVKNQPVAVASLWILFPPTLMTQPCLQTGCTRFYSCGLTLKTGFPPVTSIDSVVSSMKSSFMPIGGGVITELATRI